MMPKPKQNIAEHHISTIFDQNQNDSVGGKKEIGNSLEEGRSKIFSLYSNSLRPVKSQSNFCKIENHSKYIQIRNYATKYICCELPLDPFLGFTTLTMDTLQTKCGEAKVGSSFFITDYNNHMT